MIQQDYIMRVIEQVSAALVRIVLNKEVGNYTQALFEIDSTYKTLLNLDPCHIQQLSEEELIDTLSPDGVLDAEKALIVAELLREEAEIHELKTDFNQAVFDLSVKSFGLYVEAIRNDSRYNRPKYVNKVDSIVEKVSRYELPIDLQFRLFRYKELVGYFSQAEDILYELMSKDDAKVLVAGKTFYLRLLDKQDSDLLHGNLSRNEVHEGLAQIEQRYL